MAEIVLKDINGNESTYSRDKIMVDTADGGTQIFSEGDAVEGVEITLDFYDDENETICESQTVNAPEGMLVKSAIILKPDTLIPGNIKEGVTIAGVEGSFAGGSVKLEGDILKYIAYQLDSDNNELIVCAIFFELLYQDTGSYNIHIPEKIGSYTVVINSEGVS